MLTVKHGSFTLVELMVSLAIIAIVSLGGISGYVALRDMQVIEQETESFSTALGYAKNSSFVSKRTESATSVEFWVYGVGIDLTQIHGRKYSLFKVCDDNVVSYRKFNSLENPLYSVSGFNIDYTKDKCNGSSAVRFEESFDIDISGQIESVSCTAIGGQQVDYIVFESTTGKPHFYRNIGSGLTEILDIRYMQCLFEMGIQDRTIRITEGGSILIELTNVTYPDRNIDLSS